MCEDFIKSRTSPICLEINLCEFRELDVDLNPRWGVSRVLWNLKVLALRSAHGLQRVHGAYLTSLLRLTLILLAAYNVGVDLALQIHTYLGYSPFLVWVLAFRLSAFEFLHPTQLPGAALVGQAGNRTR